MKDFCIEFSLADSGYLTAVRLVAGAICSLHDINVDELEDFKVCVTESALILKNNGFDCCRVRFSGGEGVMCEVSGEGGKPTEGESELSLALISALVSDCEIEKDSGIIRKVTLKI